jgi:mono/diheme cytochrome c family protein
MSLTAPTRPSLRDGHPPHAFRGGGIRAGRRVSGTRLSTGISLAAALLWCATAAAQGENFPPQQIAKGAEIFARNCSPCHGPRMQDPESAFDLRKFPPGEHDRFVRSVTNGKNQMPPWGDLLKSDDIEALWAYVTMGEKK